MINNHVCTCGKEFKSSQAINAHKLHCKEYNINKYGNTYKIEAAQNKRMAAWKSNFKLKKENEIIEKNKKWESEKHLCEQCGKIMTKKFGSGRFCSRSCANKHIRSEESKRNTSISLLKKFNPRLNEEELNKKYEELKRSIYEKDTKKQH